MAEETKRSTIRLKSKIQSSEDKKIDTKKSVKRTKVKVDSSSEKISEKKIDENIRSKINFDLNQEEQKVSSNFDPLKVRKDYKFNFY